MNINKIKEQTILRDFYSIYKGLTNKRIVKTCIYLALLIFLPGLAIGVIIAYFFGPESYNFFNNYISDLGSIRYTPAPFILDTIAIITSILLIPIVFYFTRMLYKTDKKSIGTLKKIFDISMKILSLIGLLCLLSAIVGLLGIGVFSEDRTTPLGLHYIFSLVVFGSFAFACWFDGFVIMVKKTPFFRGIGLYMFIATPSMAILFLYHPSPLTKPFIEWMLLLSIIIWLIFINHVILKHIRK
ncbi:MAG: DUF998 domain-containing protein [Candidatus Lokiarchaeota archaeon]